MAETMKDYIPKFDDVKSARKALRSAKKELKDAEWEAHAATCCVSNLRVRVMGLEIAVKRAAVSSSERE